LSLLSRHSGDWNAYWQTKTPQPVNSGVPNKRINIENLKMEITSHTGLDIIMLQPLRWRCSEMRGSPQTECVQRTTPCPYIRGANKQ